MRIAIDTSTLTSGHKDRGIGVYTKFLIEALEKYEHTHSYIFFTREQNIPKNADIVHYTNFDPFFLTLPLVKLRPTVVTVHDLIPLVFPDKFPAGIRGLIKWRIQKISLRGAGRIITDSQSSKKDIARITGVMESRIDPVYLAPTVSPSRQRPAGYPPHFILYVGDVNWNKNVPGLLQAIGNRTLVLAGRAFLDDSLEETRHINELISRLAIEKQVIRAGYVENLAPLYSRADCVVVPSFYEGFGFPVVDAMAAGCPVVVADTSSLSEIAGPAVRVATDPASIQIGIAAALRDRDRLVRMQKEWVRRFTWKNVAVQTVQTYEKAIHYHSGI